MEISDDEEIGIPPDTNAVVVNDKARNILINKINNCEKHGRDLDTLCIDQVLKIFEEKENIHVFPCYSPVDHKDFPYFASYVRKEKVKDTVNILSIPLCDGAHFNGYVVDLEKKEIVYIDSIYNGETTIANILSDKLFATPSDVKYSSYFQNSVQFDSNSCGAWLIAGLTCYLLGIPGNVASLTRKNVFNVVYLLLNENGSLDDKFK